MPLEQKVQPADAQKREQWRAQREAAHAADLKKMEEEKQMVEYVAARFEARNKLKASAAAVPTPTGGLAAMSATTASNAKSNTKSDTPSCTIS